MISERHLWFADGAGCVKILVDVDLTRLSKAERTLVCGIVDDVQEYEKESRTRPTEGCARCRKAQDEAQEQR